MNTPYTSNEELEDEENQVNPLPTQYSDPTDDPNSSEYVDTTMSPANADDGFRDPNRPNPDYNPDRDAVDHVLYGIQNTTGIDMSGIRGDWQSSQDPAATVIRETSNAILGGAGDFGESVLETAANYPKAALGFVGQQFYEEDEDKNVLSENYEWTDYDFSFSENNTVAGQLGRTFVEYALAAYMLRAVPGVGSVGLSAKAGRGAKLGGEAIRGALADLIIDDGEGNFSTQLAEMDSGLANSWMLAITAHEEDDNIFIRKLKNILEGATIGFAIDGLGQIYSAVRAGRKAKAAGKSVDEAVDIAIQESQRIADEGLVEIGGKSQLAPNVMSPDSYTDKAVRQTMKSLQERAVKAAKEGTDKTSDKYVKEVVKDFNELKAKVAADDAAELSAFNKSVREVVQEFDELKAKVGEAKASEVFEQKVIDFGKLDDGQKSLDLEAAGYKSGIEPGMAARALENTYNSGRPPIKGPYDPEGVGKPALFEPNERAEFTTGYSMSDVMRSQDEVYRNGSDATMQSKPFATDELVREVLSIRDQNEGIARLMKVAMDTADLDGIARSLEIREADGYLETLPILDDYIKRGTKAFETRVELEDTSNVPLFKTAVGAKVGRAVTIDLAQTISNQANNWRSIDEIGADGFNQAESLLDRLQILMRMNTYFEYDSGLNLGSIAKKLFNSQALSKFQVSKKLGEIDTFINELREGLRGGDDNALSRFRLLSDSLVLAEGKPPKILKFSDMLNKVHSNNFESARYNGLLSSTRSPSRNALGNWFNINLRYASLAMGELGRGGNGLQVARAQLGAFHGILDSNLEALRVGWKSVKTNDGLASSQRITNSTKESERLLKAMAAQAKTPGEKYMVGFTTWTHWMYNSPWSNFPTRIMRASDDAARTLAARMEMKRQVFNESFEAGDGYRFNQERYDQLISENLSMDGIPINQRLQELGDEVTYQQALTGLGKQVDDLRQSFFPFKFFVPFLPTPTNMIRESMNYVPGFNQVANRIPGVKRYVKDYHDVMNGTDEVKKAIYRGKQGISYITTTATFSLALTGNMTGNGPRDPEQRALWLRKHPPMSIKIGGKWVSYQFLEPLNTWMAACADATTFAFRGDNSGFENAVADLAYILAGSVVNKSYFQGVTQLGKFLDIGSDQWTGTAIKSSFDFARIAVPWTQGLSGMNKWLTPGIAEWTNQYEKQLGTIIPGYEALRGSQRVDIFTGEPMVDSNDNIFNLVLPFNVTDVNNDPVVNFLSDSGVDITTIYGDELKGMDLTSQQKTKMQKYIADYGLRDNLLDLMGQAWFEKDYKAWKESGATLDSNDRWFSAVKKRFSQAKSSATIRMMREDPEFARLYQEHLNNRGNRRLGQYDELTEF